MSLAIFISLFVQLISTSNSACTPSCGANQHCSSDDKCYGLLNNFISLSMTETDLTPTTSTTNTWDLTDFFDNITTTFGGAQFPLNYYTYNLYINFTDYDWVHTIQGVTDINALSVDFYDIIGGSALESSPSGTSTNGKYFYSVEIIEYLGGLRIEFGAAQAFYIYEFYIYGDTGTPSPTTVPTMEPSAVTDGPSFSPSMAPSISPSSAPTFNPTPDVCTDISSVQQSCCASNDDYNITNRVNLLYPNATYKTCYATLNDECCGGHGLLDGYFEWSEIKFGCGEDGNNNRLVCNVSFYNSSTITGTIVNTTVLYYDSSVDPSLDSSCNCSTVIYHCIGEDTAVCVRNESQALCGQTSFAGSVSSLTVVEESVGYSTCQCEYMLSTCNSSVIDDVECEGDSCCSQEEHSCCGTSYLDAGDLDMYGYPVNDVYSWQCYNDTVEVCPDIFGGLRYYNSSYHVEWWNDTSSGSSMMNIQCQCQYLVENCNLPPSYPPTIMPSAMPSINPSHGPTVNPTTSPAAPLPTKEPTELFGSSTTSGLDSQTVTIIIIGGGALGVICLAILCFFGYRKCRKHDEVKNQGNTNTSNVYF